MLWKYIFCVNASCLCMLWRTIFCVNTSCVYALRSKKGELTLTKFLGGVDLLRNAIKNLSSCNLIQDRNQESRRGGLAPPAKFFDPLEKCVGHSLKILSPYQKTLRPTWCRAWFDLRIVLGSGEADSNYALVYNWPWREVAAKSIGSV